MEYLSDGEVAVLNAARTVLKGIASRAGTPPAEQLPYEVEVSALHRGEFRHAVTTAEHAIFDALNHANASRLAVLSSEQLFNRPDPPKVIEPESMTVTP